MKDILLVRITEPIIEMDTRSLYFRIRKVRNVANRAYKLLVAVNNRNEIVMTVDIRKIYTVPASEGISGCPDKSEKLMFEGNYLDLRANRIRIKKWPGLRRKTWLLDPKEFKEMVCEKDKEIFWVSFFTSEQREMSTFHKSDEAINIW